MKRSGTILEELEPRRLLAVDLTNGVLSITGALNKLGHPRADIILVTEQQQLFGFAVTVVEDGVTSGPFNTIDISEIDIDGGGGNDKIINRNINGSSPVEIPEFISGGSGNDIIEAGNNNDVVSGGSGNDYLAGGLGSDYLAGGTGNDTLNGSTFAIIDFGDGSDTLDGGSGHDSADYTSRADNIYVANDSVHDDGEYSLNIFGLPQPVEDDFVMPNVEDLYGGSGNDVLVGATGDNFIDGGAGNDGLFGEIGNDTCVGDAGNDTLCGGTGNDSLSGGKGNDSILGDYRFLQTGTFDPIFDEIYSPGNDTLLGGDGNDFIRGGGDTYFTTSGNDVILGGNGDDALLGEDGNDAINGEAGDDILFGDVGNDSMAGGDGDDLFLNQSAFLGVADHDLVDGGTGFNIAETDATDNQVNIQFFFDILDVPSGAPVNPQSDPLAGKSEGTFSIVAQSAKPRVVEIDGTSKNDSISITESAGLVSVNVNGVVTNYNASLVKRFVVEGGKGNDFISLQTSKGKNICAVPVEVLGAAGNDVLIGGSSNDSLYGGAGNDSLNGVAGDDSLFGGAGNDTLTGGDGDDILNGGEPGLATADGTDLFSGGAGNDSADYSARSDNLTITMNDDLANDGAPGEKDNVGSDIENLFGGDGADQITGNAGANFLSGGAGNDTLDGSDGNDKLFGGTGTDSVMGQSGVDLYFLKDGTRDDFDAPVNDIAFGASEFVSGDDQIDFSTVSSRLLGRT